MTAAAHFPADPMPLPILREDLALLRGTEDGSGAPSWTLYDPIRHRYFRIDHLGFEMLARWKVGEGRMLVGMIGEQTFLRPDAQDVSKLVDFLRNNCLIDRLAPDAAGAFLRIKERGQEKWHGWLLHRYLFFRLPILRPERFLAMVEPWAKPLFSSWALWTVVVLAMIGFYLVGRQWEVFLSTFTAFASWQGQVGLVVGVMLSKILHEFGHALTLHRYGGRVPTMGVAFLVMFPVLYTDTSDCWRLSSRRQRLAVGAGGMAVELAFACMALFLWSFAPEGTAKGMLFVVATTVWVATLVINLNPFMRFDGYYLLSDFLDIPNLQDRAFALARWRLREFLFGFGAEPPEIFPPGKTLVVLMYAYATWIYRLILFIGIALLVYHFFFKLLGLVLFAVEIGFFILWPAKRELGVWWSMRHLRPRFRNIARTAIILGAVALVLAYPWRTAVYAPSVLDAAQRTEIFAPMPARIGEAQIPVNGVVSKGQVLFRLTSPSLSFLRDKARRELAIARLRHGQHAVNRDKIDETATLVREIVLIEEKIAGIDRRLARLELIAPFDGRLTDVPDFARPGQWVNETTSLGIVVAGGGAVLSGFIEQDDVNTLTGDAHLKFFTDDFPGRTLTGTLGSISPVSNARLDEMLLASVHGGPIDVQREPDGSLRPETALFRFVIAFPDVSVERRTRGTARIEGDPRSVIARLARSVAMVFVRESGF
jgi:putative peptide zinc metalloprotease protein